MASPGASWGSFWRLLEPPGAHFGPPGASSGRLLGPFGLSWVVLGPQGPPKTRKIAENNEKCRPHRVSHRKMCEIPRFGREKCCKNAAKPRENTFSRARTSYFTRVLACICHVFHALPSAKPRVLRGSSLGTRLKTTTQKRPPGGPRQARNLA